MKRWRTPEERRLHEEMMAKFRRTDAGPDLDPGIRVAGRAKVAGAEVEVYAATMTLRCAFRQPVSRKKQVACGRLIIAGSYFTGGYIQSAVCVQCRPFTMPQPAPEPEIVRCSNPGCVGAPPTAGGTCMAPGCPEYWAAKQSQQQQPAPVAKRARGARKAAAS